MPGVIETSAASAWSYGGAILTFLFPMILFLVVAAGLYVVYTKPSVVPGHREQAVARPIGFTPVVRMPGAGQHAAGQTQAGPHYAFPAPDRPGGRGRPGCRSGGPGGTPGEP